MRTPRTTVDRTKVFISYAREDKTTAVRLAEELTRAGILVWIDVKDLRVGENFRTAIPKAIDECTHFLALLSSHSVNKKGFVQKELHRAYDALEEIPPGEIFVLPVRVDECDPRHGFLQDLSWCDLFPSFEEGVERILAALNPQPRRPPIDDHCPRCREPIQSAEDRCVVCWFDLGAPNVRAALRDIPDLDTRYRAAVRKARSRGYERKLRVFEEIARNSSPVLTTTLRGLIELLGGMSSPVYRSYHELVEAGLRLPATEKLERLRLMADQVLFPGYASRLVHAALTLEGQGVWQYGEVAIQLREQGLVDRASVLEGSAFELVNRSFFSSATNLGVKSTLADRHRLAVVRAGDRLRATKSKRSLQRLFFDPTLRGVLFEVNIWGSLHRRNFAAIRVQHADGRQQSLLAHARELASAAGISWSIVKKA
jgi:hypothetical protein